MPIGTARLSLLPFPQSWDGGSLVVRFLCLPKGDPQAPLKPGLPAFAAANLVFEAQLIGSLARLRRRTAASFARHTGYLKADAAKVAVWAGQLGHVTGKRVGLFWAANPAIQDAVAARRSRKKSLTLQTLEPLLEVEGARFVSLQTWEAARQVADAAPATRTRVLDVSADLQDFSDTAALMMNLDLIITVDTSVAHLAGALGRPVWILLPWQADWRWHDSGESSEWYPSARLYRQPALNDWDTVVTQAKKDLRREVKV